jgi:hypothetical protein
VRVSGAIVFVVRDAMEAFFQIAEQSVAARVWHE